MNAFYVFLAAIALGGALRGMYAACRQIYGASAERLFGMPGTFTHFGLLPTVALQAAVFGVLCSTQGFLAPVGALVVILLAGAAISYGFLTIQAMPAGRLRISLVIFGHMLLGALVGVIRVDGLHGSVGGLYGCGPGLIDALWIERMRGFTDGRRARLFPFWTISVLAAVLGDPVPDLATLALHFFLPALYALVGWSILSMFDHVLPPLLNAVAQGVERLVTPVLILRRFAPALCAACARYSLPLKAEYRVGARMCEHCGQSIDPDQIPDQAVAAFGAAVPDLDDRTLLCVNPDVEQLARPLDVAEVYIETATADPRLLERFFTFLLNYPPRGGTRAVRIRHAGALAQLGPNLTNVIRNTFATITECSPTDQPPGVSAARLIRVAEPCGAPDVTDAAAAPTIAANNEAASAPHTDAPVVPIASSRTWRSILFGTIPGALIGVFSALWLYAVASQLDRRPDSASSYFFGFLAIGWGIKAVVISRSRAKQGARNFLGSLLAGAGLLVLAAIIIPNLLTATSRSPRSRTVADMRAIGTALGAYQVDNNVFPVCARGTFRQIALQENLSQGMTTSFYEGASRDAWGVDFYYHSDGFGYTLKSFGKDRRPGGNAEFDSDIIYVNGSFRAPAWVRSQ